MSENDSRFDGKRIYKAGSASSAVYDIRGHYIHQANSASSPEYEISRLLKKGLAIAS